MDIKKKVLTLFFFVLITIFVSNISAERLLLQIGKLEYDTVDFRITLYDNNNNKIDGKIDYVIKDYYEDVFKKDVANSGEQIKFKLPKNPSQGPWKITANYKDASATELFNVGDIERADIRLENGNLIVENTGNVAFDNNLLITIGDISKVEKVYLAIGELRKFKLTAPAGEYTVRIDDGTERGKIVFDRVSLTGNVIGLEKITEGNLLKKHYLVWIFLITVFVTFLVLNFITRKKFNKKGLS